jgi:hypothetical protein
VCKKQEAQRSAVKSLPRVLKAADVREVLMGIQGKFGVGGVKEKSSIAL